VIVLLAEIYTRTQLLRCSYKASDLHSPTRKIKNPGRNTNITFLFVLVLILLLTLTFVIRSTIVFRIFHW
jgi:hypothetical protein